MAYLRLAFGHMLYLSSIFSVNITLGAELVAVVTRQEDYGDIGVQVLRQYLTKWLRHQPKTGGVIKCIHLKTSDKNYYMVVNEPYIDVMISGNAYYFKVRNEEWDSEKPFERQKYRYFKLLNERCELIPGPLYIKVLKNSYRISGCLNLWHRNSHIYTRFAECTAEKIGDVNAFAERITNRSKPMWCFCENEGTVFLRFIRFRHNGQNVVSLYFQDLNDNILETLHVLTDKYPYYIHPWIGMPGKSYIPLSVATLDTTWVDRNPIALMLSTKIDRASTPLVIYSEDGAGEYRSIMYISHPIAYIYLFTYSKHCLNFEGYRPFVVFNNYEEGKAMVYTLTHDEGKTVLRKIYYDGKTKNEYVIENPATKIFSFSLYLNAGNDNRLSSRTYYNFDDERATVYTAKNHLAFRHVYGFYGEIVVNESQFDSTIEQFILSGDLFYVVIRGVDGVNFIRYFKEAESPTWSRATDAYPELLPVISEPS